MVRLPAEAVHEVTDKCDATESSRCDDNQTSDSDSKQRQFLCMLYKSLTANI